LGVRKAKNEVHQIGMVACFISEVAQERFLGGRRSPTTHEIAQAGYIREGHKSLYLCMAVIHNTAYMLSGEKMYK
jgi:hypothetical protein